MNNKEGTTCCGKNMLNLCTIKRALHAVVKFAKFMNNKEGTTCSGKKLLTSLYNDFSTRKQGKVLKKRDKRILTQIMSYIFHNLLV